MASDLICLHRHCEKVNEPIFDGVVALVLIHFGVVDLNASCGKVRQRLSREGGKRLSQLLKRTRRSKAVSELDDPLHGTGKIASRTQALSVDSLIAITELCLQGVFSGSVLCDILALFNLGDVDNHFIELDDDWELLTTFLQLGLQPRATSIRAKFSNADPIRYLLAMLNSMRELKEAKQAKTLSSVELLTHRLSSSSRTEESEWVQLERFPSATVLSWSRHPRTTRAKWLSATKGVNEDETEITARKQVNLIDILNGYTSTRDLNV